MYSFIREEHRGTYTTFYEEVTGKTLQRVVMSAPSTSGLKRSMDNASIRSKDEPKIKKPKLKSNEQVSLYTAYLS